jgi:hypothetical protein
LRNVMLLICNGVNSKGLGIPIGSFLILAKE